MTVRAEPDRRKALADADFVVSAFSVGGFDSMRHDLEIPERYGVVQPIGDSVGPGGVSRALRSVPVLLDIARDVEDVAPKAFLLNVTNPLTALCRAVTRETGCRAIGLCNEWVSTTFALSLLFDSGMHEIDAVLGGVNHFPLATSMTVRGEDAFARLRAILDDVDGAQATGLWMDPPDRLEWRGAGGTWTKGDVLANNAARMELFRRFGVFACSGDHHATEFVPGFVHAAHRLRPSVERARLPPGQAHGGRRRRRHQLRGAPRRRRRAALAVGRAGRAARRRDGHGQGAAPAGQHPQRRQRHQPPRRRGRRDHGDCRRDRCTGPGPDHGARRDGGVAAARALSQELTVEAALTGDRTLTLEAMLLDPLCSGLAYDDVVAMTDELSPRPRRGCRSSRSPPARLEQGERMPPRIVVIGGGSFQWVPKLFCDLVNTPSLAEAEIVLEDIAPEPLADMTEFARAIVNAPGPR